MIREFRYGSDVLTVSKAIDLAAGRLRGIITSENIPENTSRVTSTFRPSWIRTYCLWH